MRKRIYGVEVEYGFTLARIPNDISEKGREEVQKFTNEYLLRLFEVNTGRSSRRMNHHFWENGARVYTDRNHPEYATPECRSPREAVIHDKAGERIIADIVARDPEGFGPLLFKTNLDRLGEQTFGCHENYSMDYEVRNETALWHPVLIPFLVTRTIFCGSGFLGPGGFDISQRSLHLTTEIHSTAGTKKVSIVTSRIEDHSNPSPVPGKRYARLHLVVGDSNLSEISTFLKVGTTGIVLTMIEDGFIDREDVELEEPEETMKAISRDLSLAHALVRLKASGKYMSAIQHQRIYLERAKSYFTRYPTRSNGETRRILSLWEWVLEKLEEDPMSLRHDLDWVIKKRFLDFEIRRLGYGWERWSTIPTNIFWRLKGFDLAYHQLGESSLYTYLLRKGMVRRLIRDRDIERAVIFPPQRTRAKIRGEFIRWACKHGINAEADWTSLKAPSFMKAFFGADEFSTYDPFQSHYPELGEFMRVFSDKERRFEVLAASAGSL